MTFLDTVDGKLARITLQSSKWGNIFDHGIDLVHPPFWYWAWGVGLQQAVSPDSLTLMLVVIIAGYVLQRVIEGLAIWRLGLEIHVWRKVDTWFRLFTARRNPNLVLLTLFALVGRPDLGLAAVAVWTALCLLLHVLQIAQALFAARRGKLTSWMAGPA
jgi:phosphatidylglycerophosphate synthase